MGLKSTKLILITANILVMLAVVTMVACSNNSYTLKILFESKDEIVFSKPLELDESFSISYIHSVNKSEVEEFYKNVDGTIVLDSLRYSAFGAGMLTDVAPPLKLEIIDGQMWVKNFNYLIKRLAYNVSVVSQNTLHYRDEVIVLDTLAPAMSSLVFSIER